MYFDWITWSIWLTGFIIMVIWILIPIREFRKLIQKKRAEEKAKKNENISATEKNIDNN